MKLLGLFIGGMLLVGCGAGPNGVGEPDSITEPVNCVLKVSTPDAPNPTVSIDDDGNSHILNWAYTSTFHVPGKNIEQMIAFTFVQVGGNNRIRKVEPTFSLDGVAQIDCMANVDPNTGVLPDNGPVPLGVGVVANEMWEYIE